MVQLYTPPAARGIPSRLDQMFEERASERIWNVKLQYNTDSTGAAQQLSKCPQTLVELTSAKEDAAAKTFSEVRLSLDLCLLDENNSSLHFMHQLSSHHPTW